MSRVLTSVFVLAILLTAFSVVLLSSREAAAAPTDLGWGSPAPLVNHVAGDAAGPGVALDPTGDAIAVWLHGNGERNLPSANMYLQGAGSWGVPSILDWGPDNANPQYRASVATDGSGNAIAVWSVYWQIFASRYTPGTGWGPAGPISYCCSWSADPMIVMNPAGDAFVVWWQWDNVQYSIFANHYVPGIGWTGTVWLESNDAGGSFNPRIGVDDTGNAIAVWYEWDGASLYRIDSNRFVAGTGWGTAAYTSPAGVYAYYPDVAVNRDGSAIAVYVDNGAAIRWIPYTPGPGWGAVGTISATGFGETTPRIASDGVSGEAVVAWIRYEASGQNLYTSNYFPPPGAGWSAPFLREGNANPVQAAVVAMNRAGRAILVWQQSDGTLSQMYGWWYQSGSGWTGVYGLSQGLSGDKSSPAVAMSDFGNGIVAYVQRDGTRFSLRSNRFTGGGFTGQYPVEFDNAGGTWNNRIEANAAGQAVVAWWEDDGPITNMYAATYHPASGWSPPALLENVDRGNAADADVAIDAYGDAFVIWVQWNVNWNVWSARYDPTTGWGAPYLMESLPGDAGLPNVAFDAAGNAVAAWYQYDGSAYSIYGATWTSGGGWTAATLLETGTGSAYDPVVAIAPSGTALIAWHQYDGTYDSIYYTTYSPGTGWGAAALVESLAAWSRWVRIAMNDVGQAILIWHVWNGAAYDLWADRWTGTAWTGEVLVESEPGWVEWPVIAIDGQGNGLAAWHAWDGTEYNAYRVEYRDGSWQPVQLMTPGAGDALYPSVAADRYGNMMVAWGQWDGSQWNARSQRYTPGMGWVATVSMAPGGEGATEPRLAVDGAGDVLAVFKWYDGERWLPAVNRYTVGDGAPRLDLAPLPGLTNDPVVIVSGYTDVAAKVTINGAPVAVDETGYFKLTTTQPDGLHTFTVVATNLAGNSRTETVAVTVDTVGPYISVSSPSDGTLTSSSMVAVRGTTEPDARLDVNGIATTVDPAGDFLVTVPLLEGTQPIWVTAVDPAGNVASLAITVTRDSTAPTLTLVGPTDGMVTNNPNVVVAGSTEPGATLTVNGVPAVVGPTGGFSTTITLTEGFHTIDVVATDAAGNSAIDSRSVTVDTTGPGIAITSPANGFLTNSPVVSVYGTTEPGATVNVNGMVVSVDGGGNFFARVALAEGLQVIRADATDPAGNLATTQISVTLDLTPPQLTLGSPVDGSITNDPQVLVSGITETGSTVTIDGTPVALGPSGTFSSTVALPEGEHTFTVLATDPAGNTARAIASVTVDTTPPAIAITAPISGATVTVPTVTVTGTAEPASRVVVNGYAVNVGSNGAFSVRLALASGANVITATATDAAGNVGTDSVSVTYNDPIPGLRQQLNNTNDDLNRTKDRLDATLQALGNTQATLNDTRSDLATANANLASLGTETLILLVLVLVSIVLAAVQFLMLRRMRGGPTRAREPEAPPPST